MNHLYKNIFLDFKSYWLKGFFIFHFSFFIFHFSSAQISANFSGTPLAGCSPLIVTFSDLSTGNPTSWSWNFGNGNTATIQNPSTVYSTPGVYTVTLTVSNGSSSNTMVKTNYVDVYNKPQAGFTLSNDTACVGETITFTDATVISPGGAAIASWSWDFGDGNASTVTVPTITHSYTTPGNYPISLIVTDINGCGSSVIKNIVVVPTPTPSFSATPTAACTPPLNVTFTNTSTSVGTTTYTWNFGDGNTSTAQNPSHTYTSTGTYTVTLIINQNGCIDSIVKPNYIVIQNIVPNFVATPTVICTGQSITFNNTSVPSATSANWNFGDGNNSTAISPSHVYTNAGTYSVTMTATDANGCTGTTNSVVTVNQTPVANFSADTLSACSVPFTVNFTNTSTGATNYVWHFGDGNTSTATNPSNTYTAPGTYTVTLVATNSNGPCVDSIVLSTPIVIAPPIAGFTHLPDSGCVPLTVNFLSTSTSSIQPITTYHWNFGDGNNTTVAVTGTSHTYTATGIYSVTLIVQTANGCTDTIVCPNCVKVGTPPIANFGIVPDTVCYGLPVQFNDSSTGATGWFWHFGDGQTSTSNNPSHVYADTGTYHVYLVAYNNGCADTSVIKNVIVLPPKAQFTYTLSCTNYYTVQFTSTSEGADSLVWNFGDGTIDSSNTINPTHTYVTRGPFTVTLTAYNYSSGCNNVSTAAFTIAQPIASFTVANTSGCYPFTENFTSTSQDANTYFWNFGDPSTTSDTSIINNPSYTYNNPAAYTVTLTITDVNGCRDSTVDTLKALGPLPYFFADTLKGCRPLIVTFADTSHSDSVLVQWTWDFGDGSPLAITNVDSIVHTYTTPGIYSVTMMAKDTNGCVKTIVKNNYIQPTFPYPAFVSDTFACKGDNLTLDASTTTVVGGTYEWDFGDGSVDTTNNPIVTHTYTSDNSYTVTLTVVDTNKCDSTIKKTILILKPNAHFGDSIINVGCGTLEVEFLDSSLGYVDQWYWDFGNGANSTLQNPIYTYTQPGVYNVSLIVTNAGGCKDTLTIDSLIVVPGPVGSFSFTPSAGCNPLKICFDATSQNAVNYIWDFGDGTVIQTTGDTCHTYNNGGSFNPILILGNTLPNGNPCLLPATNLTGSVTVTDVINTSLNVPHVIHVPQDSIISVHVNYSGGVPPYTYGWSPNTSINCDTCTSILILGSGDTILYLFTIHDSAGCIGIDSVLVLSEPCFQQKLIPNVFSPNGDGMNDVFYIPGVCPGENFSLQIFDRWGTLMFSSTQRNNGWDGRTIAGVEASDGTYYFVVHINDKTYKGFVELVH